MSDKNNIIDTVYDDDELKVAERAKAYIQAREVETTVKVDVTDAAATAILTTNAEEAAELLNAGDETIYYCEQGGTPDTDSYELRSGERVFLNGTIEVICDTGLTSTLKILRAR